MMNQGELEGIPLPFVQTMTALEAQIMGEIVRSIRINSFSTASADRQARRLIQMGASETAIREHVQDALKLTEEQIEQVYSDEIYREYYGYERAYRTSGKKQIPFSENVELQLLIHAAKRQTANEFRNLTNSLGFAIRNPSTGRLTYSPLMDFYRNTLDDAVTSIASGSESYDKVLSRTIRTMTNSGVRWIDYDSGVHNRVDVAARRAVMTGFRQVQGRINEQVAKDLGTDFYEVSYHIGARPSHQVWQGRVYSYEKLQSVCGLGTAAGLHGVNCYHDYNAFIPGISVRTYTDEQLDRMNAEENETKDYYGKDYTTYEALQEQRRMERTMRAQRQEIKLMEEAGIDKDEIMLKRARYQGEMSRYKDFSEKMKLPQQMKRVYEDGLGRVGVAKSKQFGIDPSALQYYKKVSLAKDKSFNASRGTIDFKAYLVNNTKLKMYVAEEVTLKPRQLHEIENNLNEAIKVLGISEKKNLPPVVIINNRLMQTGALAAYNARKDILYIDENAGIKSRLLELQSNGACPKNKLSTSVHELIHWKDADEYREKHGGITSSEKYLNQAHKNSKKKLDKLGVNAYNVGEISDYAYKRYNMAQYDEAYTEYRVKKLLGD